MKLLNMLKQQFTKSKPLLLVIFHQIVEMKRPEKNGLVKMFSIDMLEVTKN